MKKGSHPHTPKRFTVAVTRAKYLQAWGFYQSARLVARSTRKGVRACYKARKRLIALGYLTAKCQITTEGRHFLEKYVGLKKVHCEPLYRLHNIVVELPILGRPLDWDLRRREALKLRVREFKEWFFSPDGKKGLFTQFLFEDGVTVRTTPKRLLVSFRWFYGATPEGLALGVAERVEGVARGLEELLGVRVARRGVVRAGVTRSELARVDAGFALAFKRAGFTGLVVRDSRGEKRFVVDRSLGVLEWETVRARSSVDDARVMEDAFRAWLEREGARPARLDERLARLERVLGAWRSPVVGERRDVF